MANHQKAKEAILKLKQDEILTAKPSQMILLALDDIERVEKSKKYKVDLDVWQSNPEPGKKCAVCLAGSVMVQRFETETFEDWNWGDTRIYRLTSALNLFRIGEIDAGLSVLGINAFTFTHAVPASMKVHAYGRLASSRAKFKADMRAMAAVLAAAGL